MTPINFAAVGFAWLPILPLIAVTIGAIIVLLAGVRVDDEDSAGLGLLALATLLVTFILTVLTLGQNQSTFGGALVADDYAAYFQLVVLLATAVTVAISLEYAADNELAGGEYYALILFAALGMMLMAAAGDLIIIFLGLETMSIAVYALAGFMRRDARSSEAAMKYFLLGAFSTGFLLYGIALVYGATGTIRLAPIRTALAGGAEASPYLLVGLGLLLVGFGFKVAAVPFHMWTPDAYEGAPTPITGFMAVGVKLAAFAGFVRIFMVHLAPLSHEWTGVLWVVSALTMTVGNLCAVVQGNIKRMLAYSAIAHAGYLLVGMAAAPAHAAGGAILYYLLGYAVANLGAFAVVVALAQGGEPHEAIDDYRGLARRHPGLTAAMTLFMLSLTGVPPLAGFVGKFYIFSEALEAGLTWLVLIAALNSAISVYYYVRVLVAMYMQEGGVEIERLSARPGVLISVALSAAAVIIIGLFPQPYMHAASAAYASAVGRPALTGTTTASAR
jgi:NADH-quinone oxidoreductase subunit N